MREDDDRGAEVGLDLRDRVVLTHDDKFDLPMIRGALASDAFYVGWIGSHRNQERRRGLLREDGVTETSSRASAARPVSTSVRTRRPRLRFRSSRRSSRRARGRTGGPVAGRKNRIHASL